MTPRESYNFAPVYWSRWVVLGGCVGRVVLVDVGVVALVGLDVEASNSNITRWQPDEINDQVVI